MSDEIYEQTSGCSGDCSGCSSSCGSREPSKEDFLIPMNKYSNIKKVIAVVSGKGGVGKSLITSMLAVLMNRKGHKTAILDADITGPSIPKSFGMLGQAEADKQGMLPVLSKTGIKIMSVNLLLESAEVPVIWRGPVIAGTVKQFWTDVVWGDVDYMFVDMPPGTGDIPLTVFQSLPLDGVIIVTSPQDLVSMIVGKAVNMANAMDIPVLGIIENYSYLECGNCGERMNIFGKSHIDEISSKYNLSILAKIPIRPDISEAIGEGTIENFKGDWLNETISLIEAIDKNGKEFKKGLIRIAVASDENNNIFKQFANCKKFTIYEVTDKLLTGKKIITVEEEGDATLTTLLKEHGVGVVICDGIGIHALETLMAADILVVPGMLGDIDVAVASYLDDSSNVLLG